MLKELWSPAFQEQGVARRPIIFKQGLNVILGANEGDNSIGKSSTLLAIDFAFGGSTYLKSDGVENIGHHSVFFCFEFGPERFYFMRQTQNPDFYHVCDGDYKPTDVTYTHDEFCAFLKNKYGLDFVGLSIRQALSSFFRIYGKNNYQETKPLAGIPGIGMERQLRIVIQLFNMYAALEVLTQKREIAKDRQSVFKKAQDYRFLPSDITDRTKEIENEIRIKELKAKQEQLNNAQPRQVNERDLEQVQLHHELNRQLQDITAQIAAKKRHLHLVQTSLDIGLYPKDADLEALLEFFPDADLKKLYAVERFHQKLAGILNNEFEQDRNDTQQAIQDLEQQQDALMKELMAVDIAPVFSNEVLTQYGELASEITYLEKQNEAWRRYKELKEEERQTNSAYNKALEDILKAIEHRINERLRTLNMEVVGPYRSAPRLIINSYNSYVFQTPRDMGTGTNYKGMVLYDIAMLQETALPAICEDSLVMKNIDDTSIEGIFKLYESMTNKQVFIAFDKADKYTSDVLRIAQDNTVLKLYRDGGELYGTAWNKEENKQ